MNATCPICENPVFLYGDNYGQNMNLTMIGKCPMCGLEMEVKNFTASFFTRLFKDILAGRKVAAIKAWRAMSGDGLQKSKNMIDGFEAALKDQKENSDE